MEATMSSNQDNDNTALILAEVRGLSTNMTSLTRTVDRIDQRLGDVEGRVDAIHKNLDKVSKHTDLIPEMMAALSAITNDTDDHEKQLKDHEERIVGLEQATA
jgi:DNA repair ATPase RecN